MSELAEMVRSQSCLISSESRLALKRVLEQRARLYAISLPEFNALSQNDQVWTFIRPSLMLLGDFNEMASLADRPAGIQYRPADQVQDVHLLPHGGQLAISGTE